MSNYSPRKHANPSRRDVMLSATGLTFVFAVAGNGRCVAEAEFVEKIGARFGAWVNIATDGKITIFCPVAEMGQGSSTALPLVLAEELDADWGKVTVLPAPISQQLEQIYGSRIFDGMMYTADSNALLTYYTQLRKIGAGIRRVLMDRAAVKLKVPVGELTTEPSVVVHSTSSQKLTYGEIAGFAEAQVLPAIADSQLKKEFRLIGTDVLRLDLPSKVNGTAQFSLDVHLPNMLYGAVLRAPVEGSVPDTIGGSKAETVPGVVKIVRMPWGVGVLAVSPWAAFSARDALKDSVIWSRTGGAWDIHSEVELGRFATDAKNPRKAALEWKPGDVGDALKDAAATYEAEYRCDYAYHAQMEPLNAVASVSPEGDSVEIWCGTQSQTIACEAPAKLLGIPRDKVKLNDMLLGGGFGRRGSRDADFILDAVFLSNNVRRPVKVIWTREDDVRNGKFRPMSAHYLRAGVDIDGKLVAWYHRVAVDQVKPTFDPLRYQLGAARDTIAMRGAELRDYKVAHQQIEQLYRNTGVRTAPLRGIGFNANKFATESFLDEIVLKRQLDPIAYRLEMMTDPRAIAVINEVKDMASWGRRRDSSALGFAYVDYGTGNSTTKSAGVAEVSLNEKTGEIKVHEFWCAVDCGIVVQPDNVVSQIEGGVIYGLGLALTETISIKGGKVEQSNFDNYNIPRMDEIPEIHVTVNMKSDRRVPQPGVGQVATPLVAPVIANAVARLTNVRLRHVPFTADRVLKAISETR